MPMYNLLEYSDNYSMTLGGLWSYFTDELHDAANENDAANNKINNNKTKTSKSFEYKTKLIGSRSNENTQPAHNVPRMPYFAPILVETSRTIIGTK